VPKEDAQEENDYASLLGVGEVELQPRQEFGPGALVRVEESDYGDYEPGA
jgi:hypothetical protein